MNPHPRSETPPQVLPPLLRDFPNSFGTERLLVRAPRAGDGAAVHAAILESLDNLRPWMEWVHPVPTPEATETFIRNGEALFVMRQELHFHMYLKATEAFVGSMGLHPLDWDVPSFEIGYWIRRQFEGQHYMTEAVRGLERFAIDCLSARRIQIHVDELNERSWHIPERLGYVLEGVERNKTRDARGRLRNMRIYAKIWMDE